MKDSTPFPLVTVAVCTYNSADFILETLESIRLQDYKPLELVVSDDASTDDTLAIVRQWAAKATTISSLKKIEILEVSKNTGISANANRALKAAGGEWIKYIAGDDALKVDCIKKNVDWVRANPEVKVLFSRVEEYNETFEPENIIDVTHVETENKLSIIAPEWDALDQYRMLLVSDRIHFSPSLFLSRDTLVSIGGFDEEFRLLEDYPLWLNLTKNGYRLSFMDEITVKYRKHNKAINNNKGITLLVNPNYFRTELFRKKYIYPNIPGDLKLEQQYKWIVSQPFRNKALNTNSVANRCLHYFLTRLTNPFTIWIKIRKLFSANIRTNIIYR